MSRDSLGLGASVEYGAGVGLPFVPMFAKVIYHFYKDFIVKRTEELCGFSWI